MTDPNIVAMNALGLGELKLSTRVEVVLRAGKEPYVFLTMLHPQTGEPCEKSGTLYLKPDGSLGIDPS
mgnify:CR=1 FL=1